MLMNWFGNVLFARREKKALVISLTLSTISKLGTFVELFNNKHHESDWITMDDVIELSVSRFTNAFMHLDWEQEELPSSRPIAQTSLPAPQNVLGRRQLRLGEYRN